MENNHPEMIDLNQKKEILRQKKTVCILIFACVFLALCAVAYLVSRFITENRQSEIASIPYSISDDANYAYFNELLVCVNNLGIEFLDSDAVTQFSYSKQFASPVLSVGKDLVLVYDAGGNSLYVTNGKSIGFETRYSGVILCAKIASNGNLLVVTTESGYKAVVVCYDKSFSEIYRWYSSVDYVADADVNGDNVLAVATYSGDMAQINTSVQFFNFSSTQRMFISKGMTGLAYSIDFKENNILHVLTGDGLYCVSDFSDADLLFHFQALHLCGFSCDGNGTLIAVNRNVSGEEIEVLLFNRNALTNSIEVQGKLCRVALSNGYFAVLTTEYAYVYRENGTLLFQSQSGNQAKDVLLSDSGKIILLELNQITFVK